MELIKPVFIRPPQGASTVIELDRDPADRSATDGGGFATLKTYTFTPSDLRNNRYQVLEFYFQADLQGESVDGAFKITWTQGGVSTDSATKKGTASTYLTVKFNLSVVDYSRTLTVAIKSLSQGAAQEGKNFILSANVIPFA